MRPHRDLASGDPPAGLSANAKDVFRHLQHAGASFVADIVRGAKHLKAEIETALWELVTAGLATADGFDNLRSLIDPRRRAGHGSGRTSRPRHTAGRWALLHPTAGADATVAIDAACRMLLARYGVVFRELVARESNLPTWRELLIAFRRLEDRGEIRGGRFVTGFIGEQFALPIAVETLRARRDRTTPDAPVDVSAGDPLNLAGTIVPGPKIASTSGRVVTFGHGQYEPPALKIS
jgi:ATP-dependent Lhr-like helicase